MAPVLLRVPARPEAKKPESAGVIFYGNLAVILPAGAVYSMEVLTDAVFLG